MYTGNEKNPVQQIEIIKKNSREKSSLLDTLIHHALLPMTILFMAIDALTVAYYAQNIFDEQVAFAWAVSGVLAFVLDGGPALAGTLLANHNDLLKSDQRPNKWRICLLMAAAAGAYLVFLVFCIAAVVQSGLKGNQLPHGYFSKTKDVSTLNASRRKKAGKAANISSDLPKEN